MITRETVERDTPANFATFSNVSLLIFVASLPFGSAPKNDDSIAWLYLGVKGWEFVEFVELIEFVELRS